MRERVHGQIGIDLPVSGEQGAGRAVRPPRRRAPGPRPVRPYVPQAAVRREGAPTPRVAEPAPALGARDGTPAPRVAGPAAALGARDATPAPRVAGPAAALGPRDATPASRVTEPAAALGARDGAPAPCHPAGPAPAERGARDERGARGVGGVAASGAASRGCGAVAGRRPVRPSAGPRLLVSRPGSPAQRRGERLRRLLAGLALALVAAAVVVGLGRVADATAQSRATEAPAVTHVGEVTVTVTTPSTVWDVADRVAPGLPGPERAALVDRIVVANSLTSLRVAPGAVLRVPV